MDKSDLRFAGNDFTTNIHRDTYQTISPEKCNHVGHSVFITGASKGIGREMALSFAKAGASNIGVAARSNFEDIKGEIQQAAASASRTAPNVLIIQLDVTDSEAVSKAAETVTKSFGSLDILVNNAGIVESPFRPISESDPEEWWKTMNVNVRGPYLTMRAFMPLLLSGTLKTVVNVGSVAQNYITPGASAYGISKLGLARLTEFLDLEYRQQGILAYTIHPGAILTNLGTRSPDWMTNSGMMTETEPLPADTVVYLTQKRWEWLGGRYLSVTWDVQDLRDKKAEIVEDNLLKVRMRVSRA